jgi:hypothetical protein
MTDEQLIEAMARRLAKDDGANWEAAHFGETPSGETPEEMRDYYRGLATAALAKVDEVYHRIPKDQEPVGWRGMDTAPRDGTHILLLIDGAVIEGWWDPFWDRFERSDGSIYEPSEWSVASLASHGCGCCSGQNSDPTAWQPLPAIPEKRP